MIQEIAAGGLVLKGNRILMIQVAYRKGRAAWGFPKGHVETPETLSQTALREVLEESGYECRLLSNSPMAVIRYQFKKGRSVIRKRVSWYRMRPIKRVGRVNPREIKSVRWVPLGRAHLRVHFDTDKVLLKKLIAQGV